MDVISDQRREDMLVGALEGGSNYWYWINDRACETIARYNPQPFGEAFAIVMWKAIKAGETIEIHDKEESHHKIGEINLSSVEKGEELMLKNSSKHFADIISEDDDAETADVWFQYCVLGGIVYG